MRTIAVSSGLLGLGLILGGQSLGINAPIRVGAPEAVIAEIPADLTFATLLPDREPVTASALADVVELYCVRCHNERRMTGNLTLEGFDPESADEHAAVSEKMIVKLRAGMMPPPGARRPTADTLNALVETLESVVDAAAATDPNPGMRRFQRLNRSEYERVIYELLGIEVDAGRWLPADTYLGNFDNLSAAQGLSTTLLEAYLRAATEVSRIAVGNADVKTFSAKYTNPIDVSQHAWDHLEGTPYGTRGGMVITHDFPADGEYVFSFEMLFGSGTNSQDLDVSIDGEGLAALQLEHGRQTNVPVKTEPIFVKSGQRQVAAAFVRKIEGPYEDRLSPFDWSFVGGEDAIQWANYGITALPHVAEFMVTGPLDPSGVSQTPSRARVFTCHPDAEQVSGVYGAVEPVIPGQERACAESIVRRIATEAYRRPVSEDDIAGPMSFYEDGLAGGDFEVGVRTALQAILASPSFLFRLEEQPRDIRPGVSYRINDTDLAARLAFFLWGTGPDRELIDVAASGGLADESILEAQVRRMLTDSKVEALSTRFASQWLRLQEAEKNQPELYLYPDFSGQLGEDLIQETQLFFSSLISEDRSFIEFYNADYSFMNQRVAEHYGIPGVTGSEFRRVTYPDETRRGILGHGSVLLATSMSARTSPVLRGKWVMEVLMGSPPPPPPPNVPAFEETAGASNGRRLTTRERMEIHRANPTCNSCHRMMDPIGLVLDNFDVTGRWRIREDGVALDTRGTYYDGTELTAPADLNRVLLDRPIPLVRNFTQNLLAYAIGRRIEYFDQPTVRQIVQDAEDNDYRMSSFILGVVKSDPFRMMRAEASADTPVGPAQAGESYGQPDL
ncbi:DUF1592 domain-containing protein [Gemmatimonadales bacterium]|nr:DUF1592 domain-containing protein [Gemmatimonadales bacterium]